MQILLPSSRTQFHGPKCLHIGYTKWLNVAKCVSFSSGNHLMTYFCPKSVELIPPHQDIGNNSICGVCCCIWWHFKKKKVEHAYSIKED